MSLVSEARERDKYEGIWIVLALWIGIGAVVAYSLGKSIDRLSARVAAIENAGAKPDRTEGH